ncbi:MAG: hypothetical protein Q9179_003479 [Wetmoreana sp. 5 TL-2023]
MKPNEVSKIAKAFNFTMKAGAKAAPKLRIAVAKSPFTLALVASTVPCAMMLTYSHFWGTDARMARFGNRLELFQEIAMENFKILAQHEDKTRATLKQHSEFLDAVADKMSIWECFC